MGLRTNGPSDKRAFGLKGGHQYVADDNVINLWHIQWQIQGGSIGSGDPPPPHKNLHTLSWKWKKILYILRILIPKIYYYSGFMSDTQDIEEV